MKAIVFWLTISVSLHAHAADGNELLSQCEAAIRVLDTESDVDMSSVDIDWVGDVGNGGICMGYLKGIRDTLLVYSSDSSVEKEAWKKLTAICLPAEGITNAQAARVQHKFMRENTDTLDKPEIVVALLGFANAFPCDSR